MKALSSGDRFHLRDPVDGKTSISWPTEHYDLCVLFQRAAVKFNLTIAELDKMVAQIVPDWTQELTREYREVIWGLERDAALMKLQLPPEEIVVVMKRQVETLCWLRDRFPGRAKVETTIREVMAALEGLRERAAREIEHGQGA
jgi:hypothetical protein